MATCIFEKKVWRPRSGFLIFSIKRNGNLQANCLTYWAILSHQGQLLVQSGSLVDFVILRYWDGVELLPPCWNSAPEDLRGWNNWRHGGINVRSSLSSLALKLTHRISSIRVWLHSMITSTENSESSGYLVCQKVSHPASMPVPTWLQDWNLNF